MSKMLSPDFDENVRKIKELLHIDQSFDLMYKTMVIGGKRACFFFVGGMLDSDMMEKLMEFFYSLRPENKKLSMDEWTKQCLPYGQVEFYQNLEDFLRSYYPECHAF